MWNEGHWSKTLQCLASTQTDILNHTHTHTLKDSNLKRRFDPALSQHVLTSLDPKDRIDIGLPPPRVNRTQKLLERKHFLRELRANVEEERAARLRTGEPPRGGAPVHPLYTVSNDAFPPQLASHWRQCGQSGRGRVGPTTSSVWPSTMASTETCSTVPLLCPGSPYTWLMPWEKRT